MLALICSTISTLHVPSHVCFITIWKQDLFLYPSVLTSTLIVGSEAFFVFLKQSEIFNYMPIKGRLLLMVAIPCLPMAIFGIYKFVTCAL